MEPEIKVEPIANMPTTEQIKQLIEIAKHQLALREQLQQAQAQAQQSEQSSQQQIAQQPEQPLFQSLSAQQSDIQTAAPSTIFAPPPPAAAAVVAPTFTTTPAMPALSPNTITSTDMTLAPPSTASMMDSITQDASPQSLSIDNNNNKASAARRDSLASMTEESISLEAYAEADGIDLKKLTPKARRQLRNKLSARNFSVRRKEYISTLEGQVNEHKMVAEGLREKLAKVEEENKKLRREMDTLKRQNQILQQQQQQQKNPASPRISSPLPKPNLNKDISIMGTKASDSYRQQDNCILVSNAVMPVWDYNAILLQDLGQKQSHAGPDYCYMNHLVGQFLLSV
ncbi:hypothetical protein G6F42_024471 [Rhizopus arrhizus]|nr:hypothetical protein G6F42_024471 [Rhizopus arrhizus]